MSLPWMRPQMTIWVSLEDVILCDIHQVHKKPHYLTQMWSPRKLARAGRVESGEGEWENDR